MMLTDRLINYHMAQAELAATLSYANRLKVGAVLIKNSRCISEGRNGTISGLDNRCELEDGSTNPFVIHAEANVILFAAKNGISTDGCDLFVTTSPCVECSKMIAQVGIRSVYYRNQYRNIDGLDWLKHSNVNVYKIL